MTSQWDVLRHPGTLERMSDVTEILAAVVSGEQRATEALLPAVYNELRRLAARQMARERPGLTLDATALVHEAYLRLVGSQSGRLWDGRGHFFAAAAEAMRRILVERARRNRRLKHGGGQLRRELPDEVAAAQASQDQVLIVDEALDSLAADDPQAAALVKLHFFAGLTIEEVATILGVSARTAYRDWNYARAWLFRRLVSDDDASI